VPENLLTLLNYLLLILLYLFFARVLWTVWSEVKSARSAKAPDPSPVGAVAAPPPAAAKPGKPAKPVKATKADRKRSQAKGARGLPATRMIVLQPPELAGATYGLGEELTVGRAAGCKVSLPNDSYASNLHARAYQADGLTFVEDLGSTNGTFVNGERISAPTAVKVGDRVQVGATVLELE